MLEPVLADRAMDDLRQAVAAGYRSSALYRQEPARLCSCGRDDFRLLLLDLAMPADAFATARSAPRPPGHGCLSARRGVEFDAGRAGRRLRQDRTSSVRCRGPHMRRICDVLDVRAVPPFQCRSARRRAEGQAGVAAMKVVQFCRMALPR